jgi:CRP/FNR family transcriptional regulator
MKTYLKFLENYPTKKFARGESILEQGDVPTHGYVVKEGFVKTFDISPGGESLPLSFDHQYEILPMAWVFSHADRAPYFYEAFTDCEVWCVPREDFIAFLKDNANSQFVIFDFFVKRYLMTMQMKMLSLEQAKASDKILYLLKFLTMRFGGDKTSGVIDIDLPLTQQDIASSAGITRETASIELKRLEKLGVISYERQEYTVDLAKLNEAIENGLDA